EDATARERGATLILRHIAGLPADLPVVLVGDFNDIPGHPPHRALTAVLDDAWEHAPRRSGPEGTGHWFEGRAERRLDWVLSRGLRPRTVRHLDDAVDGVLPSGHHPVLVEFDCGAGSRGGAGACATTRLRPAALARYSAASAARIQASRVGSCGDAAATPRLSVHDSDDAPSKRRAAVSRRMRSATSSAWGRVASTSSSANSSPP